MLILTTIDVPGQTSEEYRAILDEMGVERRPAANIFLHISTTLQGGGYRILEIWDDEKAFNDFIEKRFVPAAKALNMHRTPTITVTPLHNFFAPRLGELPGLIGTLPGAPRALAGR